MSDVLKISDIIPVEPLLEGTKIQIDMALNIPVTVTGWSISRSKYSGEFAVIQFHFDDGENRVIITGSGVLISQLRQVEQQAGKISFTATIKKIDKYYKLF